MCPQSSLASSLPVLLSCPLCGRVPRPRITVSVVEVGRPEQLREPLHRPGAGPPLGVPVCLGPAFPASPSAPVVDLWVWRQTLTFPPAQGQKHPAPLPLFPSRALNRQDVLAQTVTEVTECDQQANNHMSAHYLLPSTRPNQSVLLPLSCFHRTIVFFAEAAPDKRLHTHTRMPAPPPLN